MDSKLKDLIQSLTETREKWEEAERLLNEYGRDIFKNILSSNGVEAARKFMTSLPYCDLKFHCADKLRVRAWNSGDKDRTGPEWPKLT